MVYMGKQRGRLISREELSKKISAECNYIDPELANNFYGALIRVIMSDLSNKEISYLPSLGMFTLATTSARVRRISTRKDGKYDSNGIKVSVPESKRLKFTACRVLKYYIKNRF